MITNAQLTIRLVNLIDKDVSVSYIHVYKYTIMLRRCIYIDQTI